MWDNEIWSRKAREAADFIVGLRITGDPTKASQYLAEDVELFHPEYAHAPKPVRGAKAVTEFFSSRAIKLGKIANLEVLDIIAADRSLLVLLRGTWTSALKLDIDHEGIIHCIRVWHSVGKDFGLKGDDS